MLFINLFDGFFSTPFLVCYFMELAGFYLHFIFDIFWKGLKICC